MTIITDFIITAWKQIEDTATTSFEWVESSFVGRWWYLQSRYKQGIAKYGLTFLLGCLLTAYGASRYV